MPFNNIYFEILVYSSLVFFNLLMLIAIVAVFYSIQATRTIKNKAEIAFDKVHDSAYNIGEAGLNFASFLSQFTFFGSKRKKSNSSFVDILREYFDRNR